MLKTSKILASLALVLGLGAIAIYPAYQAHADEDADAGIETTSDLPQPADTGDSSETPAPSISMLPTNEYFSLVADTPVDKELTISNDGTTTYRFKLYAQPYTIDNSNDQYAFAFNTSNKYTTISNWVSFQGADGNYAPTVTYEIEPGEQKVIAYRITPPASAVPAGGQYAAIFAETINDEAATGNINGIYTVSRVALLLYGHSTEGAIIDSDITGYNVPSFLLGGPITANSTVSSKGNVDVTATFKFIVRDIFGNELYANTWSYPVLPETERQVSMSWEDTPSFGIYNVQYVVSTSDHVEDRSTVVLIFPVYMIILTILLLTSIVVWIIIVNKKRKERKSRLIV